MENEADFAQEGLEVGPDAKGTLSVTFGEGVVSFINKDQDSNDHDDHPTTTTTSSDPTRKSSLPMSIPPTKPAL